MTRHSEGTSWRTRLHAGYVIESPYPIFAVEEIRTLRAQGAEVTVFNSFRPFEQPDPDAERLKRESHYFRPGYGGLLSDTLACLTGRPGGYARAAAFCARHRLSWRLLLLSAQYARIVRRRGITHLHAVFGTTPATIAMLTSWLSGVPYSFAVHAYDVFLPNPTLVDKINHARMVQCGSAFVRDFIAATYRGARVDRVRVRYLGVDTDFFRRAARAADDARPCRLVATTRLIESKGLGVLIDACGLLEARGLQFACQIVGDGPERAALAARVARAGLDARVAFAPYAGRRGQKASLEAAEVFVLPCVVQADGNHDGMPVGIMEAMAMELPVVSTPIGGIPEIVRDGESGLLVPPGNAAALADALARLIRDPDLRRAFGRRGRAIAEADFDVATNTGRWFDLVA